MSEKNGTVDGDYGFYQDDTIIEIDANGEGGTFEVDDDNIGNIDYDKEHRITFDDGEERRIKIVNTTPDQVNPAKSRFKFIA